MAQRLVVIGGDAAGMSGASQARRRRDDLEIVALEKGRWTSYSACGIPFVVGGDVRRLEELIARTPKEFRERQHIDARTGHEARAIDLDKREVEVWDHGHERSYRLGFDLLHVATGAVPTRPDLPGIDNEQIVGIQTLEDGANLLKHIQWGGKAVIVGGGYIGLEVAEAFKKRGWPSVTVVTRGPQVMNTLDPDIGEMVSDAMRNEGMDVRCNEKVVAFEPGKVITENDTFEADIVVLGLGVEPNTRLAAEAGLTLGPRGSVAVDMRQRTSADGVWSAGDCCQSFHLVARDWVHIPLGTVANKQGRVAGINMGGGYATFPGVVGTAVTKLCSLEVGRTGLTEKDATRYGFEYESVTIESTTRAGYYPGAGPMTVKLLAERRSGRVLGAQVVGIEGAAKRIDVVATALTTGMTVEDMTALDLSYAPPFSPVWDPVLIAARKAAEALEGSA